MCIFVCTKLVSLQEKLRKLQEKAKGSLDNQRVGWSLVYKKNYKNYKKNYKNYTMDEDKRNELYTARLKEHLKLAQDENRWLEFKSNYQDPDRLGKYISALSNGACLDRRENAYLYFGIEDATLEIKGTIFNAKTIRVRNRNKPDAKGNQDLELYLRQYVSPKINFTMEEFLYEGDKRLVVFQIPAALKEPTTFCARSYVRVNSQVTELFPYVDWIRDIYNSNVDWSAKIVEDATIEDLDPRAIAKAKEKYLEVHPQKANELAMWDDVTFLNKAKLTRRGCITNTAIILLGKEESEHLISPAVCKIRWKLIAKDDPNKDFRVFSIPMIMAVDKIKDTIRNTSYVYTVSGNLFPENMMRYDVFTLREPINNAIAHQDYAKRARIEIMEYEDEKLVFVNKGQFIPKSIEEVITNDCPESVYRNPFLVEAMRNVNMVETEGGGIRKLFKEQKKRFFPMPTYNLANQEVRCEIQGKVLDENFAKILVNNPDLSLDVIYVLDKVQKHEKLSDEAIALLRKKKFVEGRKNNLFLSYKIVSESKHVNLKTSYVKNKSFNDSYYKELIMTYVTKFNSATRKEITTLLEDKLSDVLTEKQKYDKITNLLASLRKQQKLYTDKNKWFLVQSS